MKKRGQWGVGAECTTALREQGKICRKQDSSAFRKCTLLWTSPKPCAPGKQWQLRNLPPLLFFQTWLPKKNHLFPCDLAKAHGWLPYQGQTLPKCPSLPHNGLAKLFLSSKLLRHRGKHSCSWLTETFSRNNYSNCKVTPPITCLLLPTQVQVKTTMPRYTDFQIWGALLIAARKIHFKQFSSLLCFLGLWQGIRYIIKR